MSAGDLIGWVGAVALSIVIVALTVVVVVASVRAIKRPAPRTSRTPIMKRGADA